MRFGARGQRSCDHSIVMAGQNPIGIASNGHWNSRLSHPFCSDWNFTSGDAPRTLVLPANKRISYNKLPIMPKTCRQLDNWIARVVWWHYLEAQQQVLENGVDIIVSTPGRLEELYFWVQSLQAIKFLVVDEADRLMDMNFRPQLRKILNGFPPKRQNLLYRQHSARNWPMIKRSVKIEITPRQPLLKPFSNCLLQNTKHQNQVELLFGHLLADEKLSRIIIFARTKDAVTNPQSIWNWRISVGAIRSHTFNKGLKRKT